VKCLSVRQPWAWALLHAGKDVENRNWPTSYRGVLAIHAGKAFSFTRDEWGRLSTEQRSDAPIDVPHVGSDEETWAQWFAEYGFHLGGPMDVRSAIIGTVEIYDCVPSYACDSLWKAGPDPDYWCWLVRDPKPLDAPIPWKGRLGLFDVPDFADHDSSECVRLARSLGAEAGGTSGR